MAKCANSQQKSGRREPSGLAAPAALLLWEALHCRAEPLPGEADRQVRYQEKVLAVEGSLGDAAGRLEAAPTLFLLIGLAAWRAWCRNWRASWARTRAATPR